MYIKTSSSCTSSVRKRILETLSTDTTAGKEKKVRSLPCQVNFTRFELLHGLHIDVLDNFQAFLLIPGLAPIQQLTLRPMSLLYIFGVHATAPINSLYLAERRFI